MSAHTLGILVLSGGGLAVVIWLLHKLGRALASIAEVLAAAAVVFVAVWWLVKGVWKLARGIVGHPRTTGTVLALAAWCYLLGWISLAGTIGGIAIGLLVWWRLDLVTFDAWAGRWLRSWWMRWTLYALRLPKWLHACGLSTRDDAVPVDVTVNLVGRRHLKRHRQPSRVTVPTIRRVRSGPSWDEVRIELVPGLKPEDVDESARALASARKVNRCQVREVAPNVVSLDFQRRDLLATPVSCPALPEPGTGDGASVDLRRVFAGYTEYGHPWHLPLRGPGAHLLTAGATGAGKNSITWCPLIAAAPAIKDGYVRVSGIDPKGMELAYGRGVFSRYAVTGADALALLDELVDAMHKRKEAFAGRVRDVPISREHPLEVLEFDEIAALTKYTDRQTRDKITERVAVLTTQGRALGFTVRGYVQEPTKDTVPVRELFPRRACLRVTSKSHVGMVLGDQAYERGAWANRIAEDSPGVGYVWGQGLREPLRIRAGWVPDASVKALEAFVTDQLITVPALDDGGVTV